MLAATGTDVWPSVVTVIAVVLGFLLTCVSTLMLLLFRGVQGDIQEIKDDFKEFRKHQDTIMDASWELTWNVDDVQDFLGEKMGYRPPRLTKPRARE